MTMPFAGAREHHPSRVIIARTTEDRDLELAEPASNSHALLSAHGNSQAADGAVSKTGLTTHRSS